MFGLAVVVEVSGIPVVRLGLLEVNGVLGVEDVTGRLVVMEVVGVLDVEDVTGRLVVLEMVGVLNVEDVKGGLVVLEVYDAMDVSGVIEGLRVLFDLIILNPTIPAITTIIVRIIVILLRFLNIFNTSM